LASWGDEFPKVAYGVTVLWFMLVYDEFARVYFGVIM
jgi:hypothetical protein